MNLPLFRTRLVALGVHHRIRRPTRDWVTEQYNSQQRVPWLRYLHERFSLPPCHKTLFTPGDSCYSPFHLILSHSSGSAAGLARGIITRRNSTLVASYPLSDRIRISTIRHPPAGAFLNRRCLFKLAKFNMRKPMRTDQQVFSSCTGEPSYQRVVYKIRAFKNAALLSE